MPPPAGAKRDNREFEHAACGHTPHAEGAEGAHATHMTNSTRPPSSTTNANVPSTPPFDTWRAGDPAATSTET